MKKDDFKKIYPDVLYFDKPYSKLVEINIYDDHVEYIEEIDLKHPECPFVLIKDNNKI